MIKLNKGQTLVTLLFIMIVGLTVTSAAIAVVLVNSKGSSKFEQGTNSLFVAESGIENAMLRLLRDSNYTGETMTVGDGSVTIEVSGVDPKIATSTGTVGDASRKIQIQADYNNDIWRIVSWKEIF